MHAKVWAARFHGFGVMEGRHWWTGWVCDKNKPIRFWLWSGSRSGQSVGFCSPPPLPFIRGEVQWHQASSLPWPQYSSTSLYPQPTLSTLQHPHLIKIPPHTVFPSQQQSTYFLPNLLFQHISSLCYFLFHHLHQVTSHLGLSHIWHGGRRVYKIYGH